MRSHITKSFRKRLEALPTSVQEQALRVYELWRADPYHGSLQFKRVSQRQPIYSVRVGIGYRALALIQHEDIYWFWIGPHHEYETLLKQFQ